MVTEERALVSVIGPTAGSGVRIENWRYTAAFSRGPGRPCHMAYLTPPGFRYEGRIGDRHVRYDGAQHSIGGDLYDEFAADMLRILLSHGSA